MARVKIDLPEIQLAVLQIPVRITDINYGNHLGNDSLVGILHEAKVQWLKSLHYSELDIEGTGLIMSDLAIEYRNEAFYGDQLTILLLRGEISAVSFELFYQVSNQENKLIAKAKTGIVCFNYAQKKVAAIPDVLKKIFSQARGD